MTGNAVVHETHQSLAMGGDLGQEQSGGFWLFGQVTQKDNDEQVMHGATQPKM